MKFKKFLYISIPSLVVGTLAALLYIADCFIAPLFIDGASFMWVGFANWTVFFGVCFKDRIKAVIGYVIGFFAALAMFYFGMLFDWSLIGVSIASLIGIFLINGIVLYFDNFSKAWLNSIPGIFVGIWLPFSGLGVGLNPTVSMEAALTMLGIMLIYGILGLLCGMGCLFFFKFFRDKFKSLQTENKEKPTDNINKPD